MNLNDVKPGVRVRTTKLGTVQGMTIVVKHLNCRKEGVVGRVKNASSRIPPIQPSMN